jgi:alpha-galactosidase
MNTTKIVFIGAGSISFGFSMLKDVFSSKELTGSTLSLVDIDPEALERMYLSAVEMNRISGAGLTIEKTENRREALPGAEFVVSSICVERCALWKLDFEVPKKYGIRHTLGENGGPGGLFFTMRTLPMILDIVRDMEELCPKAYFLNFSNPESRIVLALGRYSKINAVGLCHGIFMGHHDVARIMGKDYADVDVMGAGLNHFQWLLEVRDSHTGADLYPALRQSDKSFDPAFEPFARKLFRAFGYYPSCSDDHIGEYLPYGWEAGERGYDFTADEQNRVDTKKDVAERLAGRKGWEDWLNVSGERGVDVITGILHNKKRVIESGIVYNRGAISNLPYDAAVEVPVTVDAGGLKPVSVGDLPAPIARILTPQVLVQQMAVEAAVNGSKEMALQALLLDPVTNSMDAAVKLLDELWEYNKPYIRKCI